MDSVRHSASGILLNIVKLGAALQKDGLWAQFVISSVGYISHATARPVTLCIRQASGQKQIHGLLFP
jgi:hypothetical protein